MQGGADCVEFVCEASRDFGELWPLAAAPMCNFDFVFVIRGHPRRGRHKGGRGVSNSSMFDSVRDVGGCGGLGRGTP